MIFRLIGTLLVGISLLASVHPTQAQDPSAYSAWTRSIRAKIEKGKRHPPQARKGRVEGYVIVEFTIDRSGAVVKKLVDRTSCSAALDREALAAVQRAAPFPPIPADVQGATAIFQMPMMFLMDKADDAARERVKAILCPEVSAASRAQAG